MATTLISKTTSSSTIAKSSSLFRISFSFLRNLSTTTPTPSSAGNEAADSGANKPKRKKKKKNLIEVAQFLPNWGIGYHMAKSHWNGLSYEITKINLYKDGRHGKAWGIAHKNGAAADAPKKISGVHKRCWKYIPIPKRIEENASKQDLETVA